MCFDVAEIVALKRNLQVDEDDSKAVGSTLNKDELEKQVTCKIFSELEKAALISKRV